MRLDIEGVLNGLLVDLGTRTTVAMNVYGDTAGKKIETYAKNKDRIELIE